METFLTNRENYLPICCINNCILSSKRISRHFFLEAINTIKKHSNRRSLFSHYTWCICRINNVLYDYVMLRYLKADIPVQKIFRISWIANTLNGFIGFGGLVGAGVRTMLYRPYIKENGKLIKSIAWMTTAFINGLAILSFLGLIGILDTSFILHEKPWLWPVLIFFALFVPIYIGFSKLKIENQSKPKDKMNEKKRKIQLFYTH